MIAAEAAANSRELGAQLAAMQAEHGEISAAAKDAEAERAKEARSALAQLNDTHQAELTSVKRQILALEDRCEALTSEKADLTKQLKEARKQHEADLLAAQTAAVAAESAVASAATGSPAAAGAVPAPGSAPAPPPPLAEPSARSAAADGQQLEPGSVDTSGSQMSVRAAASAADVGAAPRGAPAPRSQAAAPAAAASQAMSATGTASEVAMAFKDGAAPPPPMPDVPAARSTTANGQASLPEMDLAPIEVPRSAHREPIAGPPLMIDVPQVKGGMVVDWNDPENVSVARQANTPTCFRRADVH